MGMQEQGELEGMNRGKRERVGKEVQSENKEQEQNEISLVYKFYTLEREAVMLVSRDCFHYLG